MQCCRLEGNCNNYLDNSNEGSQHTFSLRNKKKYLRILLNPLDWITVLGAYANCANAGQTQKNVESDQGQHCLLTGIFMQNIHEH